MGSKKQTETTGKRAHVNKKEEQTERPRKMKKISKKLWKANEYLQNINNFFV